MSKHNKVNYEEIAGSRKKPLVDTSIDIAKAQIDKGKTDEEIMPKATELGGQLFSKSTDALMSAVEKYFPGFTKGIGTAIDMGKTWAKGEMGQDFKDQLANRAASRGIDMGMPGSQFSGFGELANYGLNTYGVQQQGVQTLSSLVPTVMNAFGAERQASLGYIGDSFSSATNTISAAQRSAESSALYDSWNSEAASYANPAARSEWEAQQRANIAGIGQPAGPQLVGPLSGNVSLYGAQQGGLAGYQSRASGRLKGTVGELGYSSPGRAWQPGVIGSSPEKENNPVWNNYKAA
jgi:hypothetical protein